MVSPTTIIQGPPAVGTGLQPPSPVVRPKVNSWGTTSLRKIRWKPSPQHNVKILRDWTKSLQLDETSRRSLGVNEHPGLQYLLLFPLKREKSHPISNNWFQTQVSTHDPNSPSLPQEHTDLKPRRESWNSPLSAEHAPPCCSYLPSSLAQPISFCAGHLLTPLSRCCRHPSHASVSPANLPAQRLCRQSISQNCTGNSLIHAFVHSSFPSLPHQCNNCFQGLHTSGCPNCYSQFC